MTTNTSYLYFQGRDAPPLNVFDAESFPSLG